MKKLSISALVLLAVLLTGSFATAAVEIIIDNPQAAMVGEWTTGTMTTSKYGADYYWCWITTGGGNSATYTPTIPQTKNDWEVYTWYPAGTNRPTQAQYIIRSAAGDDYKYVNQQINDGVWFYVGTYTMNAGSGNYVRITNVGSETSKVVMADAIKFYSATANGGSDTTPPVISSVIAIPSQSSATITWTTDEPATSQVEYGLTTSYGTLTTKDTALVLNHSVTIGGLSPATLYHFRVKSDDAYGNSRTSGDYTFTTNSLPPQTAKFRAVWCDGWGDGFQSAAEVTSTINTLDFYNHNALIPEIRKNGDAFYIPDGTYCPFCNKIHKEKRATSIDDPYPWDPLADMITKGHAAGIEIHPWIVTYRIANSSATNAPDVYSSHPNWLMKDSAGNLLNGSYYHLDPGVPGVQDYITKVVLDIVSDYDVDGFNFDYIRYPGTAWGYNEITRQRFRSEYGYYPPTSSSDPNWGTWCNYRRQQVTDLVKRCYLEVMAVKPNVKMTADTITWGGISDFTGTQSYTDVLQDWRKWMQDHILDASIPMNYKREHDATQKEDYRDWADFAIANRNGRHTYIGPGVYLNTIANSIIQMRYALDQGADGVSTYDYISTNNEGRPASDFYNAVKTNLYISPVATPDMPWKSNPTNGIIFGTVTNAAKPNDATYWNWVYKATVTATGPVTRTTTTDATGTYGFIDLPPGTYSITVSKSGFPTRTYTNQRLAAGQVLRENVDLGVKTFNSPYGTVTAGWNLISLPLEPVNPDPAVVFNGMSIDNKLFKWDNPTGSLKPYDSWDPGNFGNTSTSEGYWFQSAAEATISYQAYGDTAATKDVAIPSAGWSIIGCPFLSQKWWPDVQVTRAGEMVSLSTAANTKGWLSATGWWWDNSSQSLVDLGLPEFFPASEYLQPWHGYWVQTNVNDLTLTIR